MRRRYTIVLALFAVALAALFGLVAYQVARGALERELDERLIWIAGGAAQVGLLPNEITQLAPGDEDSRIFTGNRASLIGLSEFVDDAWVFDAETLTAFVTTEEPVIGTPLRIFEPYRDEIREALENGRGSTTRLFPGTDGRSYKYAFAPLVGDPPGTTVLGIQAPAEFVQPLARLRNLLIGGGVLALLLAVGLANVLSANVVGPLEGLSRAALRIQRGRLDQKVELDRVDEVGRLAKAMERMRVGIVERDEQLRLMLAQVAHEIRNPLGGLELFATAASDAETPEERERLMRRIRDEVASLNRIINDFLGYARPTPVDLEPTDLRIAVEAAAHLALSNDGTHVEVMLPQEALTARADRDQIKRLVLNLMRNAAAVSSRVVVAGEVLHGEVLIRVADDGPGVPTEMRDRIFEPFMTDKEQGAGLGLAIVRKVADAHGGRVEVGDAAESGLGRGAEFRVYLPGFEDYGTMPSSGGIYRGSPS
jgi:signal transduction histidine kinase